MSNLKLYRILLFSFIRTLFNKTYQLNFAQTYEINKNIKKIRKKRPP